MSEKQIWIFTSVFMFCTLGIALLGFLYPKYEIVLAVFLTLWGSAMGFMANGWFSEKSNEQPYRTCCSNYDELHTKY